MLGGTFLVIITVSLDTAHEPLLIAQINEFAPLDKPLTLLEAEFGLAKVPVPLKSVQVPVPIFAIFPAMILVAAHTF